MKEHDRVDTLERNKFEIVLRSFKNLFFTFNLGRNRLEKALRSFKFAFLPSISVGLKLEISPKILQIFFFTFNLDRTRVRDFLRILKYSSMFLVSLGNFPELARVPSQKPLCPLTRSRKLGDMP